MIEQPRDVIGRFASTNTAGNPKAEAIKRVAKGMVTKQQHPLQTVTTTTALKKGLKTWQQHHDEVLKPVHELAAAEHSIRSMQAGIRNVEQQPRANISTRFLVLPFEERSRLGDSAPKQEVLKALHKAVEGAQKKADGLREIVKQKRLHGIDPGIAQDNDSIASALQDSLAEKSVKKLGVQDANGNLQAMAAYSQSPDHPDHLYVDFLATAPWNLGSDDPRATKRSGATVLSRLVDESAKIGLGGKLKLEPVEDAEPFYRHMGFVMDDEGYMQLDEVGAKKLKERYG